MTTREKQLGSELLEAILRDPGGRQQTHRAINSPGVKAAAVMLAVNTFDQQLTLEQLVQAMNLVRLGAYVMQSILRAEALVGGETP